MKIEGNDWTISLSTAEKDALENALEDAVTCYESADAHVGNKHYDVLRKLLELLAAV